MVLCVPARSHDMCTCSCIGVFPTHLPPSPLFPTQIKGSPFPTIGQASLVLVIDPSLASGGLRPPQQGIPNRDLQYNNLSYLVVYELGF